MSVLWHNGTIYTRPGAPPVEALLVSHGVIDDAGAATMLCRRWSPPRRIIDLKRRVVVPGLIDSHCHLLAYGLSSRREADLRGVASIGELLERLRRHADTAPPSPDSERWILGRGFEQERLQESRWPSRADLDAVSATRPIRITRVCGHVLVANSVAMRLAGVEPRDDGRFAETEMAPFGRAIPPPGDDDWLVAARWATAEAAAVGWTGVHCLITEVGELRALQRLHERGELPIRIRVQLPFGMLEPARAIGLQTGFGDDRLRIGAVKLFADGSLGARTAAVRSPYHDEPSTQGTLIYPQEELDRRVAAVGQAGFQVAIHAIGDAALDAALTAIERAPRVVSRPRIEHVSVAPLDLRERMRALGAVAAVQPPFVVSDTWMEERLGPERLPWAYPFRTMLAEGMALGGGTDCPVEALDAWPSVAAAVHRGRRHDATEDGEQLSLAAALELFTFGSAHAGGDEHRFGTLQPGYRADFLVLDRDPFTLAPDAIASVRPRATVVDGEIVYGEL